MAISSGFFNSVGGDRKYDAVQFGAVFSTFISDGVFRDNGGLMAITPGPASNVYVADGWAWFNGIWVRNDSSYLFTLPAATTSPRYDAVVLQVDKDDAVRASSIVYISGTPASTPAKPTLTNTATKFLYPLAYVLRPANSTTITADNIEITTGTAATPWATNRLASPRESPAISSGTAAPTGGANGDIYFRVA